jgi:hypothetical protein
MSENPRWKRRPEGSTWGDFGPDDQLGRLNLITPAKVLQGIAEVKEGRSFCLSLPLDYPGGNVLNPRRYPPVLRPTLRNGQPNFNFRLGTIEPDRTDIVSDDLVVMHTQYSTQWDSLAHVGQLFDADGDGEPEAVYYNGYRAEQDVVGPSGGDDAGHTGTIRAESTSGAKALGIEGMAAHGVQGRAVMLDLLHHFGPGRTVVGYAQLRQVLDADRIVVEEGDMVCLRTGFSDALLAMNHNPSPSVMETAGAVLDGRDPDLLRWITDSGLSILAADNYAVEAHPAVSHPGCCAALPLHEHCLFKLGVHLGEIWHMSPLADWLREHGRYRFLLTAPPLRLPGAVGSPATPIGTV